jgi:hypothetical protein
MKHRCAINVDFEYAAQRAHAMIRCKPKGICSWDFYLDGDGHHATLEFNWAGEQGSITADGLRFEVQRHGGFRGRWTLDDAGRETASAQQATTIIPTFEINDDNDSHVLRAECAFGRSFPKGRRDRYVPLAKHLLVILREYWKAARPKKYLFPGRKKGRHIATNTVYLAQLPH